MNKDIVPQDYSMELAIFDAVPVLLFGASGVLLFRMTNSILVFLGALICFLAGMLKVLWKVFVVTKKKNVWFLYEQMRYGMPLGFALILLGINIGLITGKSSRFFFVMGQPLPMLFFVFSIVGIFGMVVFSKKLDSVKGSTNWIEETCNTMAQGAFLISMHMAFLNY